MILMQRWPGTVDGVLDGTEGDYRPDAVVLERHRSHVSVDEFSVRDLGCGPVDENLAPVDTDGLPAVLDSPGHPSPGATTRLKHRQMVRDPLAEQGRQVVVVTSGRLVRD